MKIVMMGATGAVGGACYQKLLSLDQHEHISLLGRRKEANLDSNKTSQHVIDIHTPNSYLPLLADHDAAICTLGVGQPSKMSKEDFVKVDKTAVYEFAKACKSQGVKHFELLSSVGISAESSSFFLRMKGQLVEDISALEFDRFSVFQPSMILTPTNRYGIMQGITLAVWPLLNPLLVSTLKKYRGVKVDELGESMALNIYRSDKQKVEYLQWDNFRAISDNAS